jgi:hypothetical protein
MPAVRAFAQAAAIELYDERTGVYRSRNEGPAAHRAAGLHCQKRSMPSD